MKCGGVFLLVVLPVAIQAQLSQHTVDVNTACGTMRGENVVNVTTRLQAIQSLTMTLGGVRMYGLDKYVIKAQQTLEEEMKKVESASDACCKYNDGRCHECAKPGCNGHEGYYKDDFFFGDPHSQYTPSCNKQRPCGCHNGRRLGYPAPLDKRLSIKCDKPYCIPLDWFAFPGYTVYCKNHYFFGNHYRCSYQVLAFQVSADQCFQLCKQKGRCQVAKYDCRTRQCYSYSYNYFNINHLGSNLFGYIELTSSTGSYVITRVLPPPSAFKLKSSVNQHMS